MLFRRLTRGKNPLLFRSDALAFIKPNVYCIFGGGLEILLK